MARLHELLRQLRESVEAPAAELEPDVDDTFGQDAALIRQGGTAHGGGGGGKG